MRLPLVAFFMLVFISGLQSVSPPTSLQGQYGRWEGLSTLACYVALYLVAHNVAANKRLLKPLFLAILISSILVSTVAIIEYIWTNPFLLFAKVYCAAGFGRPNAFESGRSMATFGNAMFLGAYYTLIIPLIVSYLSSRDKVTVPRALPYLALLLSTIALLVTFGRAGWLGTAAGVILVGWFNWRTIKSSKSQILILVAILLIALAGVGVTGTTYSLSSRAASIVKIEGSSLTRIQMWNASLPLVADAPLLGSGPDTFKYVFGKYKPQGWTQHAGDPLLDRAHNDALQTVVTSGMISLVAYLWIFVTFIGLGIKRLRSARSVREGWLTAGLLGALLAYWIQLQFNFSHFSVAPLFWIFLGIESRLLFTRGQGRIVETGLEGSKKPLAVGFIVLACTYLAILSSIPLVADIHFARGRDLESVGKFSQAVSEYKTASSLNVTEPLYKTSLGQALFKLGRKTGNQEYLSLGTSAFEQAQHINPINEQAYFTAAASYLVAGRAGKPVYLKKAIENNSRGLVLNPVMVDAYIDMGVAYAYLNNYDEAISTWSRALAIEPNNDRVYYDLGWIHERKGNRVQAKQAYGKALRLNPKLREARAAYDRL
ncbi:MAG: O-antigen ligase family protein [Candidatus Aquicultor sp.]